MTKTGLRTVHGQRVDVISAACSEMSLKTNLPVSLGYVSEKQVSVLRDSGSSGVVVRQGLVRREQMINEEQECMLADGSIVKVPIAKIEIDTPYYVGITEALCMKSPVYDLIVGNIPGAREPNEPNLEWKKVEQEVEVSSVLTRAQVEKEKQVLKPLQVSGLDETIENIDPKRLIELQQNDVTLARIMKSKDKCQTKNNVHWFEMKKGILYRRHKTLGSTSSPSVKQLVVPKKLRKTIMTVAHDSILAGHMGVNKTLNRVRSAFY